MDILLIVLGSILIIAGIIGCILPLIPGPPLVYLSLICLQLTSKVPYGEDFLVLWALLTIAVLVADYYIPVWGTKKFGGSKGGTWGATVGLIAGMFLFPPVGMIAGPFIGAYLGEILYGRNSDQALRSAIGSFIGFITGTVMKVVISLMMTYYFIQALI